MGNGISAEDIAPITDLVTYADIPDIPDIIPISEGNILDTIDTITTPIPDIFNNTIPDATLNGLDVIANYSKAELYNMEMQAMGVVKDVMGAFVHNKGTIDRPQQSQYIPPPDDNSALGAGIIALLVVGGLMYI